MKNEWLVTENKDGNVCVCHIKGFEKFWKKQGDMILAKRKTVNAARELAKAIIRNR